MYVERRGQLCFLPVLTQRPVWPNLSSDLSTENQYMRACLLAFGRRICFSFGFNLVKEIFTETERPQPRTIYSMEFSRDYG